MFPALNARVVLQGITMHDFQFYDRDALEALQAREHEFADKKNAIIAEIKVSQHQHQHQHIITAVVLSSSSLLVVWWWW